MGGVGNNEIQNIIINTYRWSAPLDQSLLTNTDSVPILMQVYEWRP